MLPDPLQSLFDRAVGPAPHTADPGARALAATQAVALIAAGLLGTILVIGIPLLLRQQYRVAAALPAGATNEVAQLDLLFWIVLGLVAAASICLVIAVLRLLRHAQSQ